MRSLSVKSIGSSPSISIPQTQFIAINRTHLIKVNACECPLGPVQHITPNGAVPKIAVVWLGKACAPDLNGPPKSKMRKVPRVPLSRFPELAHKAQCPPRDVPWCTVSFPGRVKIPTKPTVAGAPDHFAFTFSSSRAISSSPLNWCISRTWVAPTTKAALVQIPGERVNSNSL